MAIKVKRRISDEPLSAADQAKAEQILRRLIARSLTEDVGVDSISSQIGPSAAAAAVPGAPPASADGLITYGVLENGVPTGADPVTSEIDG